MAMLPQKANTPENNESLGDMVMPAGDYLSHIIKSEFKQTKSKNGHYLALQWKVLDGPGKGRMLFSKLNLDNPSTMAVELATKELNSICQAANKVGVEDSAELHNIPIVLVVIKKDADDNWPASNEIKGYKNAAEYAGDTEVPQGFGGNKEAPGTSTAGRATGASTKAATGAAAPQKLPWEK